MAEYLIQSETLDDIADAINAKTGGSSAMTPAQMVTAIGSISGGGDPWEKMISFMRNELTSIPALDGVTSVGAGMFQSCSRLTSFDFSNITYIGQSAFYGAGLSGVVVLPKAVNIINTAFRGNPFTKIIFKGGLLRIDASVFEGCNRLEVIDAKMTSSIGINSGTFYNTQSLSAMILRQNFLCPIFGAFPSSCGLRTSGNIYVPASLVDSYKAATNWSTYADRILPIEGSIYETQYADGSPIPTT